MPRKPPIPKQAAFDEKPSAGQESNRTDLVALFRLLLREPPPGHDFRTCPTCKRYRIERI